MNAAIFTAALAILISSIPAFAQNQLQANTTPAIAAETITQSQQAQHPSFKYTCVMHPDVKLNKPGRCAHCNVKLKRKSSNAAKKKSASPADTIYVNDATFFRNCITVSFTSAPTFVP